MFEDFEGKSVEFPVVFYDGDRQTDVGNITINPTLDFKQFQKMLKETIGISYNNLTTYLIDNNSSPDRRKILITGKVNFAVIALEQNCYFLVVLKRSRRDRRRKPNNNNNNIINKQAPFVPIVPTVKTDYSYLNLTDFDLIDSYGYGYGYGYGDRLLDLEAMKQSYINSVMNGSYSPVNASFATVEEAYDSGRSRCKECMRAEKQGSKAAFHFCVYDDVVSGGFRSPVGPISRPVCSKG
ncbi:hypothetical protein Hanom_Chr14g01277711 [Helianthus anomalus]